MCCPIYRKGVKYLQVSTDEVYGTLGKNGMFTETIQLPLIALIQQVKQADMLVRAYNKTFSYL